MKLWNNLEEAAKASILYPGIEYAYTGITYVTKNGTLYCRLPSGRYITYHQVSIESGKYSDQICFHSWNTNPQQGQVQAWIKLSTWGGKLTENVVQGVARDILAHAIVNLEQLGYPVVLQVHDEIVSEVEISTVPPDRVIHEFEAIMSQMPTWAYLWPIVATKGWTGHRYR